MADDEFRSVGECADRFVERAAGARLYGADGRAIPDFTSGLPLSATITSAAIEARCHARGFVRELANPSVVRACSFSAMTVWMEYSRTVTGSYRRDGPLRLDVRASTP